MGWVKKGNRFISERQAAQEDERDGEVTKGCISIVVCVVVCFVIAGLLYDRLGMDGPIKWVVLISSSVGLFAGIRFRNAIWTVIVFAIVIVGGYFVVKWFLAL